MTLSDVARLPCLSDVSTDCQFFRFIGKSNPELYSSSAPVTSHPILQFGTHHKHCQRETLQSRHYSLIPDFIEFILYPLRSFRLSFRLSLARHGPRYDRTPVRLMVPCAAYFEIECANTFEKVLCRSGVYGRVLSVGNY